MPQAGVDKGSWPAGTREAKIMNLPKIDIASLPGIDQVTGLFGSLVASGGKMDDTVVVVMVYVYDTTGGNLF